MRPVVFLGCILVITCALALMFTHVEAPPLPPDPNLIPDYCDDSFWMHDPPCQLRAI